MGSFHLNLTHSAWRAHPDDSGFCRGAAFIQEKIARDERLLDELPEAVRPAEEWSRALCEANGFFAIIKNTDDVLVAAADRVRSIPLFYGSRGAELYLSDDADWVREKTGDETIDPVARQEFLMAGYVTGQDTLYPGLKQLQAGEMLRAKIDGGTLSISTHRYFRNTFSERTALDESAARSMLETAVDRSIRRLIEYAAGRQIVMPLSGGYDSRLIAMMLKRLGYENIFTFTYGVAGNRESEYSRRIAAEFSFPWQFIEYTSEKWQSVWRTDSRRRYQLHGSGWSSVPHLQDWLAVKELKQLDLVQEDCVFAPGHGMMSIFSYFRGLPETEPGSLLAKEILRRRYTLSPASDAQKRVVSERLSAVLKAGSFESEPDLISAFSAFEWQERQSKYLTNSIRVYEHFDYDWWLPLWDDEITDFWRQVPRKFRRDREWYEGFCSDSFNDQTNKPDLTDPSRRQLRFWLGDRFAIGPAKKLYKALRGAAPGRLIDTHPYCFYARFPRKSTESLIKKGYLSVGISAHFFLREFAPQEDDQ